MDKAKLNKETIDKLRASKQVKLNGGKIINKDGKAKNTAL